MSKSDERVAAILPAFMRVVQSTEFRERQALLAVAEAARRHYGADVALDAALDALDEVMR